LEKSGQVDLEVLHDTFTRATPMLLLVVVQLAPYQASHKYSPVIVHP